MWEIETHGPVATVGSFQRDQTGRTLWCLWSCMAFDLRAGRPPRLAGTQAPPVMAPIHRNGDPEGLLMRDGETTLDKPHVDLTILADAPPPPLGSCGTAEARWGSWSRSVQVHPAMMRGRRGPEPMPVQSPVPLDFTQSAHHPEHNPLGIAPPQVEGAPLVRLGAATDPMPFSFGPVPRQWPQRTRLGGTYDAAWSRTRAPILPADLSPEHWMSSQPGQWLDRAMVAQATASGLPMTLSGMRPDGAPLRTPIPDIAFDCHVRFRNRWTAMEQRLQGLHLDLREMRLCMTWLASFPIGAAQFDVHVERSVLAVRRVRHATLSAAQAAEFDTIALDPPPSPSGLTEQA